FAFNKSGNRGRCLQPCRLSYNTGEDIGRFLSMKDLCTHENIDKLIEAGIDSFKVEGRLKSEEYIQNVARVYRKEIDKYQDKHPGPTKGEITEMKKSYLRDHNTCYLLDEEERTTITTLGSLGLPCCKIIGFKGKAPIVEILQDLNKSDKLTQIQEEEYTNLFVIGISNQGKDLNFARKGQKVVLKFRERPYLEIDEILYLTTAKQFNPGKTLLAEYDVDVKIKIGEKAKITVKIPKLKNQSEFPYEVNVDFDYIVEKAEKIPTTKEIVEAKIFTGFYFFKPGEFSCEIEKSAFIPLSKLKEMKRTISKTIKAELFPTWEVNEKEFKAKKSKFLKRDPFPEKIIKYHDQKMFVFVDESKEEVIDKTEGFEPTKIFYFSDEVGAKNDFPNNAIVKAQNVQNTAELNEFEKKAVAKNWTIVCANIGALQVALRNKLKFWIDREMNCYNSVEMKFLSNLGAEKIVPSVELSLGEILALSEQNKVIALVFFYPLLMTSKAYAKKNVFKKNKFILKDKKKFEYRIRFEKGIMKLYNPAPVDMLYELEKFNKFGSIGIDLKETHTKEAIALLKFYIDKINKKNPSKKSKFTRGHYDKAVV
ncbi:MAG: U32 family peptidase, partial [Candidatus Diapherotrites archaeon]|nr:U32 family peptidase [Candidatus Diapherotrites archaeon]